jgi:hypothetical protein
MRTLHGKPIRKGVTDELFPHKISLEDFERIVVGSFEAYRNNMKGIKGTAEDKYIEEWFEQFLAWHDVEQD